MRTLITLFFILFSLLILLLSQTDLSFTIFRYNNFWLDISIWEKNRYFVFLLGLCSLPVSLFSHFYFQKKNFHWISNLLLLLFGLVCFFVFATTNLFSFLLFFELTSIFSFALIVLARHQDKMESAKLVFLVTTIGGAFGLIFGAAVYTETNSVDLTSISSRSIYDASYLPWLAVLCVISKSAILPFGFWLVKAMAAETPVSAYLHSATLVKLGLYLGFLFSDMISESSAGTALAILGCVSSLLYSYKSFYSENLKLALAYSTLASLGILAYFIGNNNLDEFLFFLINHGVYKSALFIVFGVMLIRTRLSSVINLGKSFNLLEKLLILIPVFCVLGLEPAVTSKIKNNLVSEAFTDARLFIYSVSILGSIFFTSGFGARLLISLISKTPEKKSLHGISVIILTSTVVIFTQVFSANLLSEIKIPDLPYLLSKLLLLGSFFAAYFQPVYSYDQKRKLPGVEFLRTVALSLFNFLQPQKLSSYLFSFFLFLILLFLLSKSSLIIKELDFSLSPVLLVFLSFVAVGGFLAVRSQSRIMTVLSFALIGLIVNLTFLMFGAPDLALTSFFVDILWLALLVQALDKLPPFQKIPQAWYQTRNVVLSIGIGLLIFILIMEPTVESQVKKLYYDLTYPMLHGENIVNAIVVGFRSFDTIVEISVLSVCSYGFIRVLKR